MADTPTRKYLRYPYEALHDTTDYLRIDILSYGGKRDRKNPSNPFGGGSIQKSRGFGEGSLIAAGAAFRTGVVNDLNFKNLESSIILPMPSNIQDGNSVDYADSSLDGFTAAVYNAIPQTGGGRDGTLGSVMSAYDNTLKGLAGVTVLDPAAQKLFTKSLAAQASNIPFGGNLTLGQILARESGQILNPNMELLFNGVKLRSFKFSFKMTPRDEKEAKEIRLIIKTFKLNMAPNVVSDKFLETPDLFQLSYRKGDKIHPYLNLFKLCFLTDMSVNYTGEGLYATYSDGSPVSYIMDLSFKELEPIYQGDYNLSPPDSVGF